MNRTNKISRQAAVLCVAAGMLALSPALSRGDDNSLAGFFPGHVAAERALEQKLLPVPDAGTARANLRHLTMAPHMAGTQADHDVAEWLLAQYQLFGFDAKIESFSVWMPYPKERLLELQFKGPAGTEKQTLATPEDPIPADKDTYDQRAVPAFNAYSPSGDVTGEVVYVNYGMQEDYRKLEEMGVSVAGKIALARYGEGYRGVKAKLAWEHKAIGLLIYSDPADDGYFAGDPVPRGPWRPPSGIQRGSILNMAAYPGDPLTPGMGSTPETKRLKPSEAASLPKIPVLPINWRDAEAIFEHMDGKNVPHGWQGTIPLTYHLGPGGSSVHLKLDMDYQQRMIYDVIARLPGEDEDSWVVFGNHHDAWVFGAVDPNSGTASMLEAARALGELHRSGWKPRRTLVFCEWDGEEFGLIGSTEWVETHAAELQKKALIYVNTDVGVAGPDFGASAVPSLKAFIREVAASVKDPDGERSVYQAWQDRTKRDEERPTGNARKESKPAEGERVNINALGSGSDYCAFLDHSGIPAMDMGFGGPYGVYHSQYDDFFWMEHFGDPEFAYHAAMGRILGVAALRLSNADVEPFDYTAYASAVSKAVVELQNHEKDLKVEFDLKPIADASAEFSAAAGRSQQAVHQFEAGENEAKSGAAPSTAQLNRALAEVEQAFLAPNGLAGRPWYRHEIYAPGSYTGYASVVLPGVTEALDRRDMAAVQSEAGELATALHRAAVQLDVVARLANSNR